MIDRPQLAVGNQVLGKADGGHEAIVECTHRLATRPGRGIAHPPGILGANRHRLLADHVLALFEGGDARLDVDRVRPAIIEHVDALVRDQIVPVGAVLFVAVSSGLALDQIRLLVAQHQQLRFHPGGRIDVRDLAIRVGVTFAHEPAAEHPQAKLFAAVGGDFTCNHGCAPYVLWLFRLVRPFSEWRMTKYPE